VSSWDFCETGDGIFIIPDYRGGDIKVYERNGNRLVWVITVGEKGFGPDDFQRPTFCTFNKEKNKLLVMDSGLKRIFVYSRLGRADFARDKTPEGKPMEIKCWNLPYSIQLVDDKVVVSAYTEKNGTSYSLYYIDYLEKDQPTTFLLEADLKYNFIPGDFKSQYREKFIPALGRRGIFTIDEKKNAYFAWEGNLRIIKIDTVSGEIDKKPIGKYTRNYTKPSPSQELITGYQKGEFKAIQKAKREMSWLRNVFTTKKSLMAIFEGPGDSSWLQFYSLSDGRFQKEVQIPGNPNRRMHFDQEKNILYSLWGGPDGIEYSVQIYRIIE
jgi:hypothetical protein